jgi:hypothetical protein
MVDNSENNDSGLSEVIQIRFRDEDFVFESNTESVLNFVQKVATKYGNSAKEEFTNFLRSQYVQWSASGYKMDIGKIEQALFTFNEPIATQSSESNSGRKRTQKSTILLLIVIGILTVSLAISLFFLFSYRSQALFYQTQAIERATIFTEVAATVQKSVGDWDYVNFTFTGDEISIGSKNVQVDFDCHFFLNSVLVSQCRELEEVNEALHISYSYDLALNLIKKLELPGGVTQLFNNSSALDGFRAETVNDTKVGTIVVSWKYSAGQGLVFVVSRQCQSTCYKVDIRSVGTSASETQSLG